MGRDYVTFVPRLLFHSAPIYPHVVGLRTRVLTDDRHQAALVTFIQRKRGNYKLARRGVATKSRCPTKPLAELQRARTRKGAATFAAPLLRVQCALAR